MKRTKLAMSVTSVLAAGVLVAACGSSGGAKSADSGTVTARGAWTREITTPSGEAAVYLEVTNGTGSSVKITGASVPTTVAESASLHESMFATDTGSTTTGGDTGSTTQAPAGSGEMTMQPLDAVTVAAHRTVRFVPGGKHIMVEGLKQSLSAGDTFTLTLTMSAGTNLRTTVTVRST
jgi:copper(I)-binding protein